MHWPEPDLGWDCYALFFPNLQPSYGPWLLAKFCFGSMSFEPVDISWSNFALCIELHLGWHYYALFFPNLHQSLGLWLLAKFHFHSISCEPIYGIWSNFAYALTVTRSKLGSLPVSFCKFTTELWLFVIDRISFPLNIFWKIEGILSNFAYALTVTRSRLGLLHVNFYNFTTELWPLTIVEILYMHWCWPDLRWYCYASIFANTQQSYGSWFLSNFISAQCLEMNWWKLAKFCICIDVNRTGFGLLCINLSKFSTQLYLLVIIKISCL